MEDKSLRKFAKFSFRFSVVLGVLLAVYLVVGVFVFDFPVNRWCGLALGIALLSYVPKLHLGVIEEERNYPGIDGLGKQLCFVFFFLGSLCIIGFFMSR
jgi:hypothetical protein